MSDSATPMPAKAYLSPDAIREKAKKAHPPVEVDVPEWGGTVHVRRFSVSDLDRYYAGVKGVADDKARGFALAQALCDPSGNRLFTDKQADELADLDADGASRVLDVFFTINVIGGRRGN